MVEELFFEMFGADRAERRPWNNIAPGAAEARDLFAASNPCGPQHTGGCCSNKVVSLATQRYIVG